MNAWIENEKPDPPAEAGAVLAGQMVWLRRLWLGALVAFLIAGLTGSLMRYWMVAGFPAGIDFSNVRHAHSHLMYFAWATPALMSLIAARLPALTGRGLPRRMLWAIGLVLVLGLLSYPPFFLWGYAPAIIGERRLPFSIVISTLNLFGWYFFIFAYHRATRGAPRSRPLKLWNAALNFLIAASLGAWARALLSALKIEDAFLSAAAVHLFLDMFSNGWAILAILGLAYAARPELSRRQTGWEDPLLFLGLPLSFLLGVPVDLVPADLRTLAGIGGLLASAGLFLHFRLLWPHFRGSFWGGWGAPLAFLLLKALLDAAASIAPLALWGEAMGLRVFYLHLLLLGFVTLGIVYAGHALWPGRASRLRPWMSWSVLALLLSLLPLTGLWPAALGGVWRLWAAFLLSLAPVLAGLALSLSLSSPAAPHPHTGGRRDIPLQS